MNKLFTILALIPTFCFAQWTQIGSAINGQMANDRCGFSTAISANGTIVAMGSNFNQNGGAAAGQVRVFEWANNAWTQIGADLNGETGGDQTGQAVSLSSAGSIVAIGEPFNNDLGYTSGQVRVFQNVNNQWSQIGQDLYGESALAGAGTSLDLSDDGTIVAFGAPNTPAGGLSTFVGKVKVLELQNNNWVQRGSDIEGDGLVIKFGQSVSLSADGNIIAIGQTGDPTDGDTGRVKIYEYTNNQWVQKGSTIFGNEENDEFGNRVSLSSPGNTLAIGTYAKGNVKVFDFISGDWVQIGNTITGESAGDAFGCSVSLSGNGSIIAIGARFNNLDGAQAGRAYVFENQGGVWGLIDQAIVGAAAGDQTGFSIALSQDGSKVAVGATNGKDDLGAAVGNVRVFENNSILNIDDLNEIDLVKISPNPTSKVIQIQSKEAVNFYQLLSINGQMIESSSVSNLNELLINIDDLAPGMYLLTIETLSTTRSVKVVKK
jgi:hypothetical protein